MLENLKQRVTSAIKEQARVHLIQYLKSKTVVYGLVICVLSLLQSTLFLLPISPIVQGVIGFLIGGGIIVLRILTYLPLSSK